ncbi:MAG: hypothetical protein RIM72_08245 [Alphaproteobacteria bacterium]
MDALDLDRDRRDFLAHPAHSLGLPALFYGSLRAPEIFEVVIGRALGDADHEHVQLEGYELSHVLAGGEFPGIFPSADAGLLDCIMVRGLTWAETLRVAWYEWPEYKLGQFTLTDGRVAQAFVPDIDALRREHGAIDFRPWDYDAWRRDNLTAALPGAHDWMSQMPDLAPLVGPKAATG